MAGNDRVTFEDLENARAQPTDDVPDDPPPPYAPLAGTGPGSVFGSTHAPASTLLEVGPPDPNLPTFAEPTNSVLDQRTNSPIYGTYLINPTLSIPKQHLPPLPFGYSMPERWSLWLSAMAGSINADVWLEPRARARQWRQLVRMGARSCNGDVTMRVRCSALNTLPPPISLRITANDGRAALYLPRTFCGHLQLCTVNGRIRITAALAAALSSDVTEKVVTGQELTITRHCFVGAHGYSGEALTDDAIVVSKNGLVRVGYADQDLPVSVPVAGFGLRSLGTSQIHAA